MALLSNTADLTDKDFASWRQRLKALRQSVFPSWTEDSIAGFGNILLEMYAHTLNVCTYYLDNHARESRIATVRLRKNMLALAKMLNYVPAGATAATADVTFTLSAPVPVGRTVIFNPSGLNAVVVKTNDAENPEEFELLSSVTITAGNSTGVGTVSNSKTQDAETFTSTGLADQAYTLSQTPYLDGSASVSATNGAYTQVDNFLSSTSSDRHFTATVDENDEVTITFGDGTTGAIPVGTITINYKTGGGASGNVAAATLIKLDGSFVDSAGDPVTVSVTNVSAASGGADRESLEEIRENAPQSLKSLTRTVSRDDFEAHAILTSGIDRALMLTKNEDGSIADNSGKLYVVPTGIGFPSTNLKNSVTENIIDNYPPPLTFALQTVDPIYIDVGVSAVIYLKPGYDAATVRTNILTALTSLFALRDSDGVKNTLIDFGYYLKQANGTPSGKIALSDVYNAVRDVDGVRAIGTNTTDFQLTAYRVVSTNTTYTGGPTPATLVQAAAHTDVPIQQREFPRLKKTTLGGTVLDVTLTIDGVSYPPA